MIDITKLASSKKLFDDAKKRQMFDGKDISPIQPSFGKGPIPEPKSKAVVPSQSAVDSIQKLLKRPNVENDLDDLRWQGKLPEVPAGTPSNNYMLSPHSAPSKSRSKSLNEMIHEYDSGKGSHPLSHELDRPKNTSGDKDIQKDNYDYSQPSNALHPYGWIGPEGDFYKVPHYAGHHVVEEALVGKGKIRPWPQDNMYDNHVHVSPQGMNYPDKGLTEAQYNKLLDYNDAVQGGHFDNHTGLGINRDETGISDDRKQHIKDFTEKAPKYLKDSYVKANIKKEIFIKMSKSKKVLANFFKLAEDDSDINGSTGAVLDVALKVVLLI